MNKPAITVQESAENLGRSVQTDSPVLDARAITKYFRPGKPTLNAVSFSLADRESLSLIGHNGSGKSTLLRCCMNLVEPSSGSIHLFNSDLSTITSRKLRQLRSRVGFVFQKHNLVPTLSVLTNVLHGAQSRKRGIGVWYQGFATKADRQEAMRCLDRVGLAYCADKKACQLSGGESQRAAIARALMQQPRIIMADEPSASLDPSAGDEVMSLFIRLIHEDHIALLYVSHNLRHALDFSDRIIGLKAGILILDSPSSQQTEESLRSLYGSSD